MTLEEYLHNMLDTLYPKILSLFCKFQNEFQLYSIDHNISRDVQRYITAYIREYNIFYKKGNPYNDMTEAQINSLLQKAKESDCDKILSDFLKRDVTIEQLAKILDS